MAAPADTPLQTANNELIIYRLDEIKHELAEFKKSYVTKEESAALKAEISELRNDVTALKGVHQIRTTVLWVGLVASAIINVVALYNIFTKRG
jgi:hypothetical protein